MANQHLKTAATNLRQATNDLKNNIQQIQANANQQKREMEKRIESIKSEQAAMKPGIYSSTENSAGKAQLVVVNHKLDKERQDIEKIIFDIQDRARKEIDYLNQQMREFDSLASRVDSAA